MLLRGSHLKCVSCDKVYTDSSQVHMLGLPSSVVFSLPLASHHVRSITLLTKKTKGGLVILVVYIDDILLIGSDGTRILAINTYL